MLSMLVFSLFLTSSKMKVKPPKKVPPPPAIELISICEEAENQFRWRVDNMTDEAQRISLRADDRAGYTFHGIVGPQSSLNIITYRKLRANRGADSWTLRSKNFSQSIERSRDACNHDAPPPPPPVEEPPTPAPLPHSCLSESDPLQGVEPLAANVLIRSRLTDNLGTFVFNQVVGFNLSTCDHLTLSGSFSQTGNRNILTLGSELTLGADYEMGATKISLIAADGGIVSQSDCSSDGCSLNPFLVKDLQGSFGLASPSFFYIVVDYDLDGVAYKKAALFFTD